MASSDDTDGPDAEDVAGPSVDYWLARLTASGRLVDRHVDRPLDVTEPRLLARLDGLAHLYRFGLDALAGLLHSVDAGGHTLDAMAVAVAALDRVRLAVHVQRDALSGRAPQRPVRLPDDWRLVAEWPDGLPWQDIAADAVELDAVALVDPDGLAEVVPLVLIRPDAVDGEDVDRG